VSAALVYRFGTWLPPPGSGPGSARVGVGPAASSTIAAMARSFWVETLGCPKNQVDSDKLTGALHRDGLVPAAGPDRADVIVVNTCAFIEAARQESIDTVLELSQHRAERAQLVVTGCLAERYGDELAEALPEADVVAGFGMDFIPAAPDLKGVKVAISAKPAADRSVPSFDLLELPRPSATAPWAYLKVAEGCDRACGFCAIPSFRGPQRSRSLDDLLAEVDQLAAREIVLVAQDLASYGRDQGHGVRNLVPLIAAVADRVDWVRLLYLYPSELSDELVGAVLDTGVPYFDLSLQHTSAPLLRRMRRWGNGQKFLDRIEAIRAAEPGAVFRSNFIVGYPGETEDDHDDLLAFVDAAQLDWCGFFAFSREVGTYADGLDGQVSAELVGERLAELTARQDAITAARRDQLIGSRVQVLVDRPGAARSYREAPEIDGLIRVPDDLMPGSFAEVVITDALGPDLAARSLDDAAIDSSNLAAPSGLTAPVASSAAPVVGS
jgi:ribosomal protein S12 methylthiotransferase